MKELLSKDGRNNTFPSSQCPRPPQVRTPKSIQSDQGKFAKYPDGEYKDEESEKRKKKTKPKTKTKLNILIESGCFLKLSNGAKDENTVRTYVHMVC